MQHFSLSWCGSLSFRRGGWWCLCFHVTFEYRYFLFCTVIVKKKGPGALPVRGGLLSEVFTTRSLKNYSNRGSTKRRWQVHPGDTFQPQGLTPTPMTRRTSSIFSPRRYSLRFGALLCPPKKQKKKKPKLPKQKSMREFRLRLFSQHFYQVPLKGSNLCICPLMSTCRLFGFIFVLALYFVLCIEMPKVYWKQKINE